MAGQNLEWTNVGMFPVLSVYLIVHCHVDEKTFLLFFQNELYIYKYIYLSTTHTCGMCGNCVCMWLM